MDANASTKRGKGSVREFKRIGDDMINKGIRNTTSETVFDRRFKSWFGISPLCCALVWFLLVTLVPGFSASDVQPHHLLWGLLWLKTYATEAIIATQVGPVDEKTCRKWCWFIIESIAALASHLIVWDNRLVVYTVNTCLASVDGTDFRIQEPSPFWKGWYSHKFNKPAVRYEVAICILTGDIVWINGPFPAGKFTDLKIFRMGLKRFLRPWEQVEVDLGYRGEVTACSTKNDYLDPEHRRIKDTVRARHETVNDRFKKWRCLNDIFRHDVSKHQYVFHAIAAITQLTITMESPLFSIDNYESFFNDGIGRV